MQVSTRDRIRAALEDNPATARQLCLVTNRCDESVRRTLADMVGDGEVKVLDPAGGQGLSKGRRACLYALTNHAPMRPDPAAQDVVERVSSAAFYFTDAGREVTAGDVARRAGVEERHAFKILRRLFLDGFLTTEKVHGVTLYRKAPFVRGDARSLGC